MNPNPTQWPPNHPRSHADSDGAFWDPHQLPRTETHPDLGRPLLRPPGARPFRGSAYVLYPDPGTALFRLQTRLTGPAGHVPNTVRPVEVLDNFGDPAWHSRTLYIGTTPDTSSTGYVLSSFNFDLPLPTAGPGSLAGEVAVQIEGLHEGGQWFRRFDLAAFDQLEISVAAFRSLRVRVLRSTLVSFDVVAILSSDEPQSSAGRSRAIYGQTVAPVGPAQYLVPQGAAEYVPAVADPGFGWLTTSVSGPGAGTIFVPDPASPGVPLSVKGTRWITALAAPASMEGVWIVRV